MALDGIVLRAVETEFRDILIGSKIDKVHQPEKDELFLNIRGKGKNFKLLVSASSNNPRTYITDMTKPNPMTPPMFCMLLRKHIQGGVITDVYQIDLERILVIEIESMDELGYMSKKNLIVEIMNKHSNIILVKKDDGKIIDSIKRISLGTSSVRQVLPGLEYSFPPSQHKEIPTETERKKFFSIAEETESCNPAFKFLYKNYLGMSPLIAREIVDRAKVDTDKSIRDFEKEDIEKLYSAFSELYSKVKNRDFDPTIVFEENGTDVLAFSAVDLNQFGDRPKEKNESISWILDFFYTERDRQDRIKQKSGDLRKSIMTKMERLINKTGKQEIELRESHDRDKYKTMADLIMANIYRINKGDKEAELENFYDPEMKKVKVKLDPKLSPADNAQKYYKRYNKLKHAGKLLQNEIEKSREEIEYLDNIIYSIDSSTSLQEIDEIREELIKEGYMKNYHLKNKKQNQEKSKPHHYISSSGEDIFVGKNNRQNDRLTMRTAMKDDLWFHTKDIPGSHVILKTDGTEPSEESIREAAMLAAYYSKGNMSENVAVDYTEKRNVKKPSGSKPGMVIYENNNTIYITPDKNSVLKMQKEN